MDIKEFRLKASLDEAIAISNKPVGSPICLIACKATPLLEDHESFSNSGYIGPVLGMDDWEAWIPSSCPKDWTQEFVLAHKDLGMIEYVMQQFEAKGSMS